MKGKTIKFLTSLLSLTALLCFSFACAPQENGNNHVHEYSTTYSYDNDYHWFECECGEDKGKTAHVIEDGECVCGFKQTAHTHVFEVDKSDTDKHWKECLCGEKSQEQNHVFETKSNTLSHWQECACGVKKSKKDHSIITLNLKKDSSTNPCTDSWYSQKEECTGCDYEKLIISKPTGHSYTNIRVGQLATETQKATLIGDCENCDDKSILIKDLYSLNSEEAKTEYKKKIIDRLDGFHTATYTYDYEGETYVVSDVFFEDHLDKIDDYTSERYPGIVIYTGEVVSCVEYAKVVYICEGCNCAIVIQIKGLCTTPSNVESVKQFDGTNYYWICGDCGDKHILG